MEQYIVFTSHEQLFCLPVTVVRRIVEAENFVPIPDVPDYILGVYEYEEQMLPIIDLKAKLFSDKTVKNTENKVILCQWHEQTIGIYVESIRGIMMLEDTDYERELTKAKLKRGYIGKFLKLDDEVVISLELEYLFNNEQAQELMDSVDQANEEKILNQPAKDAEIDDQ
ncbi:purine-binding chemotaxis protein CheW [Lactobacillus agilis]|uniref:Purine-binding chemotaxis protein CheW n=1 Tax=Ligilactobacillus agilis TaxID=1601 RepID=A0A848C337_9LACO|nr:chemotaxis protein CheW [Ligilactobacillus agilis]MDY4066029.1 chemotaxis protein CheW [Ligilactobacillus agilis]NME42035.1 purine-binding chemotaxis protein CheW [Ligilactobacillus agilis]